MKIKGSINIEKVTIGGIDYLPQEEFIRNSCNGCDFFSGVCPVNKVCKCFGEGIILKQKGWVRPNLTDYTTIQGYHDACVVLHRLPLILSDVQAIDDTSIAMLQLETIAEAIRGEDGPILFDSSAKICVCAPCFGRYKEEEMDAQPDMLQESALWVHTGDGVKDIFAMSHITKIETNGYKCINPRIMQHSYD